MADHITSDCRDGVLRITLDRPEKKNALTVEMYRHLTALFAGADQDPDVRAILLQGHPEIFSAGNDLTAFLHNDLGGNGGKPPVIQWIESVILTDTPLVAAVSGPAIGVGATILLHFDFVYADESAYFHMPFTDLATVPEAGASWVLPRRFGRQIAAEFLLACDKVSAARAHDIGYVTKLVTGEDVRDHAFAAAKRLAQKPPRAMQLTKALMREDKAALLAHIEAEARHFADCLSSEEMQAVIKAMMARG